MKKPAKSLVVKVLKVSGVLVATVLLLMVLLPVLFPEE
jgi:hypothetical protein